MAKNETMPAAAFSFDELIQLIESYTDVEQSKLFDHLRTRELESIQAKIGKLPNFERDEFRPFDNKTVREVTTKVLEIRKRRYTLFVHCYSHPHLTDEQLVSFIRLIHSEMSYSSCVRDLNKVKWVMGKTLKANKELVRYEVIAMLKRAYQKAEGLDNPDAMVAAANAIGRNANLNVEDAGINWDEMLSSDFEPTDNIKVFNTNIKPFTDDEKEKIRRKYTYIEEAKEA